MILSCQNIEKTFPGKTLLEGAGFLLNEREKAAIVGINGTGKSTLLNILTKEENPDRGDVIISKDVTLGYLKQEYNDTNDSTIYDIMLSSRPEIVRMEKELSDLENGMSDDSSIDRYLSARDAFEDEGGYTYKSMISSTLKGLGFCEDDFHRPFNTLSGGQKTRVHLAALLFKSPDLLILDEPTNHLDIAAAEYLEDVLRSYKGAVLLVSHDRYFLDSIVTKVIAIEERKLVTYQGSYTDYEKKSRERYLSRLGAWKKQQDEIRHEEKVIEKLKSFNREKSIKRAESREKRLSHMDILDKPEQLLAQMSLILEPGTESGNDVLTISGLSKSYGDNTLFSDTDIFIEKGEHVAIIGDNGSGKTTLLKMITGIEEGDAGTIKTGAKVVTGYYDQEHLVLTDENTLFEEISDAYPGLDNTRIRNTLAAFLFTGDDVFKKVGDLSGGEKGRLSLAKLMLSNANFLILDEPTNHLDIVSRQILEDAVNAYTGTLLYVSHDRYFVNRTADRILHLSGGHFYSYNGNYDYYLEKRVDVEKGAGSEKSTGKPDDDNTDNAKQLWQQQKQEQGWIKKQKRLLEQCEEKINLLESELEDISERLSDPGNGRDLPLLTELTKKQAHAKAELEKLYKQWEELAESL